MPEITPSPAAAGRIVRDRLGWAVSHVQRFPTGLSFFVYDIAAGEHRAVIRMGRPSQAHVLRDGLALWSRLAPLGVPLPEVLAEDVSAPLPYVIMSRLPGTDLGQAMASLSPASLVRIAHAVAEAQMATARSARGQGFGYAASPALAPHASWPDVIRAHIGRSRRRIVANGLFGPGAAAAAEHLLAQNAKALAGIEPIAFLHDTTTKNVIVSPDGALSGIVDVDDLCYGDPLYPAALTSAAMLAWGGPQDYVSAWLARAGLVRDPVFDFYVVTFLLDFMSEHGTSFNGNETPSHPAERDRLSALCASAAAQAGLA